MDENSIDKTIWVDCNSNQNTSSIFTIGGSTVSPSSLWSTLRLDDYGECEISITDAVKDAIKNDEDFREEFINSICEDEKFKENFSLVEKYIIGCLDDMLEDPESSTLQIIKNLKKENETLRKEIEEIKKKINV